MYKDSDLTKKAYSSGDIAKMLGKTIKTIQEWDRRGLVHFRRYPSNNRRYLTRDETIELLKQYGLYYDDRVLEKHDVIYARVSSHDQKSHGDLDRQISFLVSHCHDLKDPIILSEVGSGLNDNRKQLQKLITMVMAGQVNRVFITYKDRLTRFGYHYLETVFQAKGVLIIPVKGEEPVSTEAELVEDMMALVASFSGKLYGMRSRKQKGQVHEKTLDA